MTSIPPEVRAKPLAQPQPHRRGDSFQNRYCNFEPFSLATLLRWRWNAFKHRLPAPPSVRPRQVVPDVAFLQTNACATEGALQPTATFIGHATMLLQIPLGAGGVTVLTDPVFSNRASPVQFAGPRRAQPPGLALSELPHVDVVVISHNHYDHLDSASVKALAAQAGGSPRFVVPLGLAGWFKARGISDVVELDWWESHAFTHAAGGARKAGPAAALRPNPEPALELMLTPAQHWSSRGLHDRLKTLWGGFAMLSPDFHCFYSGDTGYSQDFADIAAHLAERHTGASGGGFDLALLPIGAYQPRNLMRTQHVDPPEAVQIHRDLGAQRSIGLHWGTFELTDESIDEPPRALAEAAAAAGLAADAFTVMAIGETRLFPRRAAR